MTQHARLAPSASYRWINCPGSIKLSEGVEETQSYYAAEGSAAHAVAEMCLRDGHNAAVFLDISIGEQAIKVDAEMVDGVQMYLDVCRELMETAEEYEIEQRLEASGEIFGTGDFCSFDASDHCISVVDFKYGKGVAVDVENNPQLLTYALGLAKRYHNRGVAMAELVIVQPRAPHPDGPVRAWRIDVLDIYEHAITLEEAAERVNSPEPELVPGPWCKFCKAAAICPALYDSVLAAVDGDPRMYDEETLAAKLTLLPKVQQWCKQLEGFAHAEAVRGRCPPGFKLVDKRAVRKWKDEAAAAEQLEFELGLEHDDIYETSMRSPAQLEKLLPRKDRSAIGELAEARSSGTVLAPVDDPRPVSESASASGFEAMSETEETA